MNAKDIKGNPLAFLPQEVIAAALALAAYQDMTGNIINFGMLGPYPAARFIEATPRQVYIKIENVSKKVVRQIVKECEGLKLASYFHHQYPEIYLRDYQTEGVMFTLNICGDREKNIKEAIAREAERHGKAAAECIADQLMQERSAE